MVADRGERQRLVFGLIHRLGGTVTSRDLVEAFGLTQGGAATELNRYRVQGFLRREREPGGLGPPVYRYSLTRMGVTKTNWWINQGLLHHPEQESLPGLALEDHLRIRPVLREEPEQRIRPKLRD